MNTADRPPALVAGGHFHSLGAVRNLARQGVPVYVVDHDLCVSQFSRDVRRFRRCSSMHDGESLVSCLLQLADGWAAQDGWDQDRCVLFPSDDECVRIFAQERERLSGRYLVTTPPWETVRYLYDKRLTHRLAVERDIPVPATYNPQSAEELDALPIEFPVVVKPAITMHLTSVTKKKAYRANDRQELAEHYRLMSAIMDPAEILVQELIPGRAEILYSYVGFFVDGEPVAGLTARRPRQHPMEFGRASTYVETVEEPELRPMATRFLKGIGYTGLAEVEFMYDRKHERFELIEVNPRIWGWHTIAVRAGLDLPYMAYAHALGEPLLSAEPRSEVKWVRLVTDVPTAVEEILKRRLSLRQYLGTMRGDIGEAVFTMRDPLPFLADVLLVPYYTKKRGR